MSKQPCVEFVANIRHNCFQYVVKEHLLTPVVLWVCTTIKMFLSTILNQLVKTAFPKLVEAQQTYIKYNTILFSIESYLCKLCIYKTKSTNWLLSSSQVSSIGG